nr:hypothetical protein [Tanacetum cinerariifolium]
MQIEDYLYQQKLHEPLAKAKHTGMKAEDWTLLDRQALGVVRLSLAKNVSYNVVNEKTTYGLFKALSNMYEKPSTVTSVSGLIGTTKLKFDNILDLILGEDIRKKTSREYPNSLLSVEDKGMGRKQDRGQKQNRSRLKSKKRASKDKEVYMAVKDYDDAFVCCVKNTINDRIMDSSASFHATYCKKELERFKLCSGKVRLADDKTLDIADVGDVILKTSFARGNKRGSMYMVEVPSNRINTVIDGRGNAALWPERLGHMSEKGFRIPEEEWQGKEVSLAHLKVFGSDSYVKVKDVARDKIDAKSMKSTFIDSGNLTKQNMKDQVVLEDSSENLTNKSIVAEHGLSLEITQCSGGSSYLSEKSKNSGSFEDNGRSDKEDSQDGAFSEEEGFETL